MVTCQGDEHSTPHGRGWNVGPVERAMPRSAVTRTAAGWVEAVAGSTRTGPVLVHPDRGPQTLAEVVVSNAHDAAHHLTDIIRTLEAAGS